MSILPILENFFAENGKTDILGFSYYPYWEKFESDRKVLSAKLREYAQKYGRPVMIAEVGGLDHDEEGTYQILADCINAMGEQDGQEECGVFYWEPEVTAKILPDAYPLGAAKLVGEKTLQYHKALRAYREC
ncbi:glycosyl hydrolase 53 family protein [Schaedlerella arabinosiphila]|uniref:glycosyl hydrolase 53 family protein n=1 Tax=Schaedlerella arabinosiphila TaxID=2044587 RepID=UPI002557E110|nr:glycosyl hydrolase 53 family protein [Schaedlerella arabinosiphila]